MNTSAAAAAAGLVIIFYYLLSAIWAWYRLRKFRGPFLASFSWLWLARVDASGAAWKHHMRVKDKYRSSLIRIGPNLLITDSPSILRQMSSVRSSFRRGDWYDANRLDVDNPSMFGSRDTAWHDDIKARTSAGYTGKEVPGLEKAVDHHLENLKRLIRKKYLSTTDETHPVDLARVIRFFAVDCVGSFGFGTNFGNLASDSDVTGYIAAMDKFAPIITLCADIPPLRRLFLNKWVSALVGPKHTDKHGPGRIMGIAKEQVQKRFAALREGRGDEYQDMLASFLRHGLTEPQCEAEATLQLAAGSDTTTNVMISAVLYISSSPAVYRSLQKEIDDVLGRGAVSSPIQYTEAFNMPYLQAVVYESIRIHPPNVILTYKETPREGATLDGVFVPGRTNIAQNSWSMLRCAELFGSDANVFRPERWLAAGEAKRREMERATELLFGYGRWMCPGKQIAFLELSKFIFELFKEFDIQIIDPKAPWSERQFTIFFN